MIYIAGPMSGKHELNFPAFNKKAEYLRSVGHEVINPAELGVLSDSYERNLARDIMHLMRADVIYMLNGWQNSAGARLEYEIAILKQMVIRYE